MRAPNAAPIVEERREQLGTEDGTTCQWNEGQRATQHNVRRQRHKTRSRNRHHNPGTHFGDKLTSTKPEFILRVACGNPNTLPASANHWQNSDLSAFINKCNSDILGLGETNRFWPNVPNEDQFHNIFKEKWENVHTRSACNKTEKLKGDSQIGGTAMLSVNKALHWVNKSGCDSSGLGRWVWTRYTGKGGKHLLIV
jgi:hypothetical protein